MDWLETATRFFSSYPIWARVLILLGLALSAGALLLAPRSAQTPRQAVESTPIESLPGSVLRTRPVFLKIKRVRLHPDDPSAEVQLRILVNGIEFVHPSVGGIEWMRVGPGMAEKVIELPKADDYGIRFEMRIRNERRPLAPGESSHDPEVPDYRRFNSQAVELLKYGLADPLEASYALYEVEGTTRLAEARATVDYVVFAGPVPPQTAR